MARAKNGALFSQIDGSIGGIVCQQGISGQIIRSKTSKIVIHNQYTLFVRTITNRIQQSWKALTDVQRTQWNLYAPFIGWKQAHNPNRLLTGFQCYAKINFYFGLAGYSFLSAPVFDSTQPPDYNNLFGMSGPNLTFFPQINLQSKGCFCCCFATQPLSNSVTNAENRLKFFTSVYYNDDTFTVDPEYVSRFGISPAPQQRILFKTVMVHKAFGTIAPAKFTYTNIEQLNP